MKQLPLTLNTKRKFIKIAVVLGSRKDDSEVAMDVLTVRVCLILCETVPRSLCSVWSQFVTNEEGSVCHWKNQ